LGPQPSLLSATSGSGGGLPSSTMMAL
jgi:hypothetical protein